MRKLYKKGDDVTQLAWCDCCYQLINKEDAEFRKTWWHPLVTYDLCKLCAGNKLILVEGTNG